MLLSDQQILTAVEHGEIVIDPFAPPCLQPASYDARLGPEAYISKAEQKVNLGEHPLLTIRPGDFALVMSLERIQLPNNCAARIGIRSEFTRQGLVALQGPQIDPGFNGRLFTGLVNLSPNDIVMQYMDPFCTIEFYQLSEHVKKPYAGRFQSKMHIDSEDIQRLRASSGMTFSEVVDTLRSLSSNIGQLTASVHRLEVGGKWALGLMVPIVIALIGIMIRLFFKL